MRDGMLDRDDETSAAATIQRLCPSLSDRKLILGQLLSSAGIAEAIGPQTWAVTLFDYGFRLNVGPVEVLTFFDLEVGVFLLGPTPSGPRCDGLVQACSNTYRSMPDPQSVYFGSPSQFRRASPSLQSAHRAWVRAAAVTSKGHPHRAKYWRTHSTGLVAYARRVVSESEACPNPATGR